MKTPVLLTLINCLILCCALMAQSGDGHAAVSVTTLWPTRGWATDQPGNVGLDEKFLGALDSDLAGGKYSLVDSFAVYRCGKIVFERKYAHDYGHIYEKEAKTR